MNYFIYFIITIGILVFVHEFGHFAAAKICKMRADIFAIGFGKRLFGFNKITGFTFGELPKDFDGEGHTDYRLCMLPLGGYVKILGMVDESFDTKFANEEPKPYEFRAKPTYQKLFVITAGVLMNLLLTFVVFWNINFFQGKEVRQTTTLGYVLENSIAEEAGFRTGDQILNINDVQVKNWEGVLTNLFIQNIGSDVNVALIRNSDSINIVVPGKLIAQAADGSIFINSNNEVPIITSVLKPSPADDAGLIEKDIILDIDNRNINSSQEVIDVISASPGIVLPMNVERAEDTLAIKVKPGLDGKIGISIANYYTGPSDFVTFGFIGSISQAVANIVGYTELTYTMIKNVIFGDVQFNKVFGGPIKIAKYASQYAETGIVSFMYFLAILSLSLAIINILPFPVLDGGHFIIILIEGIIGREIPIKVKIAIQNTGFVILLLLMAFIIYNDIISF